MVTKRVQIAVLILFALIILFFTFFGETLYYATKPHVKSTTPNQYTQNGERVITIPKTAYFDGVVFLIEREAGFSVSLNRVYSMEIEIEEDEYNGNNYRIVSGLEARVMIVRSADKPLTDGVFVVIE